MRATSTWLLLVMILTHTSVGYSAELSLIILSGFSVPSRAFRFNDSLYSAEATFKALGGWLCSPADTIS